MRKLFVFLVAIFLATSAFATVETADNGPQQITTCYAIGTDTMTSGNVVILSTTSTTRTVELPGKEVTGTTTQGSAIYGVVVDTNTYTPADMVGGKYIRVQTYGYCPIIKVRTDTAGGGSNIAAGDGIATGAVLWHAAINGATGARVTGSAVAIQAATADTTTIPCFITGGL